MRQNEAMQNIKKDRRELQFAAIKYFVLHKKSELKT